MSYVLTHSGRHFNLLEPRAEDVDILDIAHALSNEARYGGHSLSFYSVAQHSWGTSHLVGRSCALEALLHDAHEAYCKDIMRPLKDLLPDYLDIEGRIERVVRARFGLPAVMSDEVHQADLVMLATEKRDIMPPDIVPWPILEHISPSPRKIVSMAPAKAKSLFIQRYVEIYEWRRG